jgi:hypothetical protein
MDNAISSILDTIDIIRKIIQYIPLLWEDKDWDYTYILILLQYKLARTRRCIVGNEVISDRYRVAKQIRTCELLLDRLIKDDYCKDLFEEWHAMYPTGSRFTGSGIIPPSTPAADKLLRKAGEMEEYQKKQDLELFAKIFTKHVRTWWD